MPEPGQYAICYIAAKGSIFKKVFNVESISQIESKIKEWYALGLGWSTDQQVLYQNVMGCNSVRIKCLEHDFRRRVDRSDWLYQKNISRYYIDCHLSRPFTYNIHIQELFKAIGF
jgi:hypothetical protein